MFVFISWLVSQEVCIHIHFFVMVRNKLQTLNTYLLQLIKRRSKVQENNKSCERALNLTNEKHFPKTINHWEFNYGLLTNLPRIIVTCNFSLPLLINAYPSLKSTSHIKLKFFLWTKLLEKLLLAIYLISVAATLITSVFEQRCLKLIKKLPAVMFYLE